MRERVCVRERGEKRERERERERERFYHIELLKRFFFRNLPHTLTPHTVSEMKTCYGVTWVTWVHKLT